MTLQAFAHQDLSEMSAEEYRCLSRLVARLRNREVGNLSLRELAALDDAAKTFAGLADREDFRALSEK